MTVQQGEGGLGIHCCVEGSMGRPMREHRTLVEGAIYRYRTGIAWRDLPAEFGPW